MKKSEARRGVSDQRQIRVAPSLAAGSTGEDAKEDRRSAHEGSTQLVKAALMAMQVGETESLK